MIKKPADSADDLAAIDREIERLESIRADFGAALDTFYSPSETEARREARTRLLGEFYLGRPLDAAHLSDVVRHAERTDEAWLFGSGVLQGDGVAVDGEWEFEDNYDDPDDFVQSTPRDVADVPQPASRRSPVDEWLLGEHADDADTSSRSS